jgi:hypothetical protein
VATATTSSPASFSVTLRWRPPTRRAAALLAAAEMLVAAPAVPSGIGLVRDGMGLDPAWIAHTLLPDYTIPGVLLATVIGGGIGCAAVLTLTYRRLAYPLALASGVVLLAWLAIETLMLGWHGGPQLPLDLVYGSLGAALAAAGLRTLDIGRERRA